MNIGNIMNAYQYGIQSYGRVSAQTTPYYNMDQKTFLDHLNGAKENADNSLADIGALSKGYSAGRPGATNFADAFLRYDVTTHTGNANISDAHWQRNDFPVWRYFDKSATADCLNDWKPMGANPPQTDSRIQRGLSGIGAGKMSIIIPEALQEKMDADENYAKEIM